MKGKMKTVLLLEGNERDRKEILTLLSSLGHLSVGVASGSEALKLLSELWFDVIIVPDDDVVVNTLQMAAPLSKIILLLEAGTAFQNASQSTSLTQKPCTVAALRNAFLMLDI